MSRDTARRFHLVDGMILVAATAAGLALARFLMDKESWPATGSGFRVAAWLRFGLEAGLPLLAGWTFALIAVRLRLPRPTLRRVARQPGFVACAAAALAVGLCAPAAVAIVVIHRWPPSLMAYTPETGFAVTGAWLALALSGRWRAEAGWVDRAGRLVGLSWVLANVVNWLRLCLS